MNKQQTVDRLNRLIKENERLLSLDATDENIERSNKAGERLANYVLKGATDKQKEAFYEVQGTFSDPSELAEISRKIFLEKQRKTVKTEKLRKTQTKTKKTAKPKIANRSTKKAKSRSWR